MLFCPFCGSRQDIDLRKVQFRDLGSDASLSCPDCREALNVVEIGTSPAMTIERCPGCMGMFFNHGELEKLLEEHTSDVILLDKERLERISEQFGFNHEVIYLQCPMCHERMSHRNFGGRSGVILDRCGTHGMWVQGGELRRLLEWWSSGGKHIHQQSEQERLAKLKALNLPTSRSIPRRSEAMDWSAFETPSSDPWVHDSIVPATIEVVGSVIGGILAHFSD